MIFQENQINVSPSRTFYVHLKKGFTFLQRTGLKIIPETNTFLQTFKISVIGGRLVRAHFVL